ncbi:alpha/beta hydrolase [Nocardioides donggukensis]|uniref:Alpha/beta fold hydrolase n=1 Tax=Nocardioides donggukensis TaxID=2774019 RepID=A0A927K6G2_9ACTN|nr:alpha/beta hydrolase [Nocardioides donggukensis]MBD8868585.1 alpha/beta fold hydrolase [Nocardioides donggukensis]
MPQPSVPQPSVPSPRRPGRPTGARRPRPLVLLAAAALLLGLSGTAAAAPQTASGPTSTGVTPAPTLEWGPCPPDEETPDPDAFDCATMTLPLSHAAPAAGTVEVALKRHRARDPGRRARTIFINPGGPGGSGVDVVPFVPFFLSPRVLDRFHVVGFDPRGVARSDPLLCFDSAEQARDLLDPVGTFPVTHADERRYFSTHARIARLCARNGGPVMRHMSTANVARDLDAMRSAVGDRRLTYFAGSYGSQLGVTYATLFPDRVRALVLDAMPDPALWTTGRTPVEGRRIPFSTRLGSHVSTLATLQEFFRLCHEAGPGSCAFAGADPDGRYRRLAARLRTEPTTIPTPDGPTSFGYAELVWLTRNSMYDPFSWPSLAEVLSELSAETPSEAALRGAYARLRARLAGPEPGQSQTIEGFAGVACTDGVNPRSLAAWSSAGRRADRQAEYFGRAWTWFGISCASWPARDPDAHLGPWGSTTAAPILLVGNTFDPATPYSGAERVADLFPRSRLLTLAGHGHTALGLSSCVDGHTDRYLRTRRLPAPGTVCRPDFGPFDELPELAARAEVQQQGRMVARRAVLGAVD